MEATTAHNNASRAPKNAATNANVAANNLAKTEIATETITLSVMIGTIAHLSKTAQPLY
jgi:hypothetical protein